MKIIKIISGIVAICAAFFLSYLTIKYNVNTMARWMFLVVYGELLFSAILTKPFKLNLNFYFRVILAIITSFIFVIWLIRWQLITIIGPYYMLVVFIMGMVEIKKEKGLIANSLGIFIKILSLLIPTIIILIEFNIEEVNALVLPIILSTSVLLFVKGVFDVAFPLIKKEKESPKES